jgi:hypothetical protein
MVSISITNPILMNSNPLTYMETFKITSGTYTTGGITLTSQSLKSISNSNIVGITGNNLNIVIAKVIGISGNNITVELMVNSFTENGIEIVILHYKMYE